MPESKGVGWEYLDGYAVDARRCSECRRWFRATHYRVESGEAFCPECVSVESIKHSFEREIGTADAPREMHVSELLDEGSVR